MPWENRFETKTASQSLAYRQLIAKEAMRRRNELAILERYHFRDELAGPPSRAAPHWSGKVVDGRSGCLTPVAELRSALSSTAGSSTTLDRRAAAAAASAAVSDAPEVPPSRQALHTQSKSSVLNEGYTAQNGFRPTPEYRSNFSSSASIAAAGFASLNPEAADRIKAKAAAKLAQAKATDALMQRSLLAKRLESAQLQPPAALVPSQLDDTALGDVAPAAIASKPTSGSSNADEHVSPRFGLRSCFGAPKRPLSAVVVGELQSKARAVFEKPPLPRHVEEARALVRAQSAQRDDDASQRYASQQRASALRHRPASSASTAGRTSDSEAARVERLAELESALVDTLSQREAISGELQKLCNLVESAKLQQQPSVAQPRVQQPQQQRPATASANVETNKPRRIS